jgi:hypothetical protein
VHGTELEPGAPVALFPAHIMGGGLDTGQGRQYDVDHDGRFLINTLIDAAASTPITLIGNPRRVIVEVKPNLRCRGFSITRFEGRRWRLRRTRAVMEKVWECGLMLLRDGGHQDPSIVGEDE